MASPIAFEKEVIPAEFRSPDGRPLEKRIEIRTNPITWRKSRIALARQDESEPGTERLPQPPPASERTDSCPFCPPQVYARTPQLPAKLASRPRLERGESLLFPNLFPYGPYSAVSLIGGGHFVEIGRARADAYAESLENCLDYLRRVHRHDPEAVYLAITQNHLPSAGGSLVHPHLQIQAETRPTNQLAFLERRSIAYSRRNGGFLYSEYLRQERLLGQRHIGRCGEWEWLAAYAPEGFFELWAVLPGRFSLLQLQSEALDSLAEGIIRAQRFYRSLNRNGYNLGLVAVEKPGSRLELRLVMLARSNFAPWVRNDHTGFEVILGDMATFVRPEETARLARPFWNQD